MSDDKRIPEFSKIARRRYYWPPVDPIGPWPPRPWPPGDPMVFWPPIPWPPGDYLPDIYRLVDEKLQQRIDLILAKHQVAMAKIQQSYNQELLAINQKYSLKAMELKESTLAQIEKRLG
jgi:hypothetical protein